MEEKIKLFVTQLQQDEIVQIELQNRQYNAVSVNYAKYLPSNEYILLLPEIIDVLHYASAPDPEIFDTLDDTLFYIKNCINLPDFVNDEIMAITTNDNFLYALLKRLRLGLLIWKV